MKPRNNPAVMADRVEPPDSLDYFPSPPWATRALMQYVIGRMCDVSEMTCWEPAAGEGHMAEPLREYFKTVVASDVHDYGKGYEVGSFVGDGVSPDIAWGPERGADWIITNPPFRLGEEFVRRAMVLAKVGVAMLARTSFIESAARYPLFTGGAFYAFCPFASRVPMVKGRWDPGASSATSYSWFIWTTKHHSSVSRIVMIPPEAKERCTGPGDVLRFGSAAA